MTKLTEEEEGKPNFINQSSHFSIRSCLKNLKTWTSFKEGITNISKPNKEVMLVHFHVQTIKPTTFTPKQSGITWKGIHYTYFANSMILYYLKTSST